MEMPWRSPPESWLAGESTVTPTAAEADHVAHHLVGDALLLAHPDKPESVGDVAADEEVAPQGLLVAQRTVLIDRLDAPLVGGLDVVVVDCDPLVADEQIAPRRRIDSGHDLDHGRLAGAVVADQADDLVGADREVDVLQRPDLAEQHVDVFQADGVIECPILCRCRGHLRLPVPARSLSFAASAVDTAVGHATGKLRSESYRSRFLINFLAKFSPPSKFTLA